MQNKAKSDEVALYQWLADHIPLDIDIEKGYLRAKQELQSSLEMPVSKRPLPKPAEPAKQEPPKATHDVQRFEMTKEEWQKKADALTAKEFAEWERSRNQKPAVVAVERADSAEVEKSKSPRFINSLEPGPDHKVHYSLFYPSTTLDGELIEKSPSKSGKKTSPAPESDAESVRAVLAQMASHSIMPSSEGLLGFPDDDGRIIGIKTSKREEGLVTELLKDERVIATFDEGALKAELRKLGCSNPSGKFAGPS